VGALGSVLVVTPDTPLSCTHTVDDSFGASLIQRMYSGSGARMASSTVEINLIAPIE
jgi:hypothetical protein